MEKSSGNFILPSTAEIIERIKLSKGLRSDGEVARALGIKPQTLATSKLRSSIPFEALIAFCDREGFSLDYLIRGFGLKQEELKVKEPAADLPDMMPYIMLPLVEAEAAASFSGSVPEDCIKDRFPFKQSWLKKISGGAKKLVLIRARGQSMQPTINDGELVLVNLDDNARIKNDAIYVVRAPDSGILLKRLVATPEGLLCLSDNKVFDAFEIKKKPAEPLARHVLGRVCWVGRELV